MQTTDEKSEVLREEGKATNISIAENYGADLNNPKTEDTANLKRDKHGLPLVPQPTAHKDDPVASHHQI
jgi:hypothetical protein